MSSLVFSQPALLWALPLGALPVIIHLINRHRARVKPFAALDFLFRVQRRTARRILLRQVLLLIIRTLIVIALVLAAAGPRLESVQTKALVGPTTTALVLDTSLSMRTRNGEGMRFDAAREQARKVIRSMSQGDRICLLRAGDPPQLLTECTDSAADLLRALDAVQVGWGRSDLGQAMTLAAAELQDAPASGHRIRLISDGSRHAFSTPPRWPAEDSRPDVQLDDVATGSKRRNHALTSLEQSSNGIYLQLSAGLAHWGPEPLNDLPAWVTIEDETVSRGFADLLPGQAMRKVFSIRAPDDLDRHGAVVLDPDDLPEDDRWPFLANGRAETDVVVVNGDMQPVLHRDELFYLDHALSPTGRQGGIRVLSVTPDRFHAGLLQAARVVILANVREIGSSARQALSDFLAAGGGLLLAMGDKIDVDALNRSLEGILPWSLRDVIALGPPDADGEFRQGLAFGDFDASHPILTMFSGEGRAALASVITRRAVLLEPGNYEEKARVLIRFSNGTPALIEGRHRGGKVLLLTFSLDRDWTNWPARASFLPFVQQTVAYLAGRLDALAPPDITVGQPMRIPLLKAATGLRVHLPSGGSRELKPDGSPAATLDFNEARELGWYGLEQLAEGRPLAGKTIPGFFVRPPANESDPSPMPAEAIQAFIGQGTRLTLAGNGGDESHSRSWLLILLALCLVLCESFLIRR